MYISSAKNKKSLLGGLFLFSAISTGFGNFFWNKKLQIKNLKLFDQEIDEKKLTLSKNYKRVKIFKNDSFPTTFFNKVFLKDQESAKDPSINQDQLKDAIKKFVISGITEFFLSEGLDINKYFFEIYYKTKDLNLEVLILINEEITEKENKNKQYINKRNIYGESINNINIINKELREQGKIKEKNNNILDFSSKKEVYYDWFELSLKTQKKIIRFI